MTLTSRWVVVAIILFNMMVVTFWFSLGFFRELSGFLGIGEWWWWWLIRAAGASTWFLVNRCLFTLRRLVIQIMATQRILTSRSPIKEP